MKSQVKTLVWSVLLYGSETWTLKQADIRRLESCEMWFWSGMERVNWTDKITNEEVLTIVGERHYLIDTIYEGDNRNGLDMCLA